MIKGPVITIEYDPIEFPSIIQFRDVTGKVVKQPDINDPRFTAKFADNLVLQGDLSLLNGHVYYNPRRPTAIVETVNESTITITWSNCKFIKRADLLPYFKQVVQYDKYFIVDGQYFPIMTDAFHSMFTLDGDTFAPRLWQPYHDLNIKVTQMQHSLENISKLASVDSMSKLDLAENISKLENYDSSLEDVHNRLGEYNSSLENINSRLDDYDSSLVVVSSKLQDYESSLADVSSRLQQYSSKLESVSNIQENLITGEDTNFVEVTQETQFVEVTEQDTNFVKVVGDRCISENVTQQDLQDMLRNFRREIRLRDNALLLALVLLTVAIFV